MSRNLFILFICRILCQFLNAALLQTFKQKEEEYCKVDLRML